MSRRVDLPAEVLRDHWQHGFFDNFDSFLTSGATSRYTVVTAVDGTVLQLDVAGGGVAIKSAVASASGNEDTYLVHEQESFIFAQRHLHFGARIQITEDDTNQNNVFVGLTNGAAANLLVNDGGGVKTSGNTVGFYKVDGELNWHVYFRDDADALVVTTELTAANSLDGTAHVGSGSSKQFLEIEVLPRYGTIIDVVYRIDDVEVYKITGADYGTATDMQPVAGVKDGDASDEVTLNLYSWFCYQNRA